MIDNEGVLCEPQPRCASCGADGTLLHRDLRDETFGAPGIWSVRRCGNAACGLAWTDPKPRPDQVIKLYQTYYTHGAEEAAPAAEEAWVPPPPAPPGARQKLKRLLARLFRPVRLRLDAEAEHMGHRPPGTVLDIGCGNGEYMHRFRALGWQAVGVDFDERAVAEARRQGFDARVGTLADCAFPDASFDGIFMGDVIEHVDQPAPLLAECHRVLKPGGRLVMKTPNIDSRLHETFGPDWRGLEVPRHLYIYCERSLARAARAAGFGHVEVFSRTGDPIGTQFMIDESRQIAARAGRSLPAADAAEVVRSVSGLKSWIAPGRGEWVMCVAER